MFTGIITDLGRVRTISARGGKDTRIAIETRYDTTGIAIGASIACSGACLTVVEKGPGWFAVDVSAETLARTTLGRWQAGTPVNLERSLKVGDELGGHLVSGHVDGVATLIGCTPENDSLRLTVEAPAALRRFIAEKGSVALDGVSLTINEVGPTSFGLNIIPHTQKETSLGAARPGARLNLEIDLLARYVARLTEGS
ncbi:MAG: riboflavin synthase [Alphaproteobacteria bacterium]|nr:riboflavin synthase [Alphaproteobacteria bacterium]